MDVAQNRLKHLCRGEQLLHSLLNSHATTAPIVNTHQALTVEEGDICALMIQLGTT